MRHFELWYHSAADSDAALTPMTPVEQWSGANAPTRAHARALAQQVSQANQSRRFELREIVTEIRCAGVFVAGKPAL